MASNSDFVPEDVYVELEYEAPNNSSGESITIRAIPFRTPAAINKAHMLEHPTHKLIKIGISDGFAEWLDAKVSVRESNDRIRWWEKIQALPLRLPDYPDGIHPIPPKSYAEAFERSEQKAIEKTRTLSPCCQAVVGFLPENKAICTKCGREMPNTLSDKINALDTAVDKAKSILENGGMKFDTGAVRSADKAGVMYHLISPIGLRRIAETYKEGFDKYGAYNWEKGFPIGDVLNHAIAHIYAYLSGEKTGEDDLAHAAWNLIAAMHIEETHAKSIEHQLRFQIEDQRDNTSS